MSSTVAPSYNHATQQPPTLQYEDHDLHRYVTEEGAPTAKQPMAGSSNAVIPPQPALIVSGE